MNWHQIVRIERIVYPLAVYLMFGHLVVQTFYCTESRLKDALITLIWPIWAAWRMAVKLAAGIGLVLYAVFGRRCRLNQ